MRPLSDKELKDFKELNELFKKRRKGFMSDKELEEFFEKIGTEPKPRSGGSLLAEKLRDEVPSHQEDKNRVGKLVQYSMFETGYAPVASTVKTLPSGCYSPKMGPVGIWFDPVNLVTDSLIQFPDSKSDSVIAEIETFWTLKKKFSQYGFSHKRGYILWGPAGSGKTCTTSIIVQKMLAKNGLILIAENPAMLGIALGALRSVEPDRELIVIWEDLDAVVERHGESNVLSILDGESQIDNVVFIATTNYPEKLDARITNRPSRFDRIEKIDMPNDAAREMYLMAKVQTTAWNGVDLIAETRGMSIAHLRELIVGVWCQGLDARDVLSRLKKMRIAPNSARSGESMGLTVGNALGR